MSTLGQLINETTNIKNEIVSCHSNLKGKLIEAGIEVLPNDKLNDLVNKVEKAIHAITEEEEPVFNLFSSDQENSKIYELDSETLLPIRDVKVSFGATDIGGGFDGTKLRLFSVSYWGKKIYELDADTLKPIKTVATAYSDGTPTGVGGGFDGTKLRIYYVDKDARQMYEVDTETLIPIKTTDTIESGVASSIGGGFDGTKLRLYYTGETKLYELNPDTLKSIKSVSVPSDMVSARPEGIGGGFDKDGLKLFHVDSARNKIYKLDPNTLKAILATENYVPYLKGIGGGHHIKKSKFITIDNVKYKLTEV